MVALGFVAEPDASGPPVAALLAPKRGTTSGATWRRPRPRTSWPSAAEPVKPPASRCKSRPGFGTAPTSPSSNEPVRLRGGAQGERPAQPVRRRRRAAVVPGLGQRRLAPPAGVPVRQRVRPVDGADQLGGVRLPDADRRRHGQDAHHARRGRQAEQGVRGSRVACVLAGAAQAERVPDLAAVHALLDALQALARQRVHPQAPRQPQRGHRTHRAEPVDHADAGGTQRCGVLPARRATT